jgi:hypothetical protein
MRAETRISKPSLTFNRLRWFRAPFRLLSARAPRQAVLRASFWLAPSFSFVPVTRSCDLKTDKARDASDRLLPPIRDACTRTSCVPGLHYRGFHRVGTSWTLGSTTFDRGTERFMTPVTASADRRVHHSFELRAPSCAPFWGRRRGRERGRFVPTVSRHDRASDIPVASPSSASLSFAFAEHLEP